MSSDPAIRVAGLGKCYHLYARPADRLRQALAGGLRRLGLPGGRDHFVRAHALDGVDLEVARGETLGIIGRNGSGKSTLLQIVCGTLAPTSGEVEVRGRVAALLELGSGFNPEFSGRENVMLNAALHGLTPAQAAARFDDIAAFADLGEYLERPVKTYSSGMVVRLAFAVVAHVDADILVIDEALAVGDAVFSQKCMRFLRRFKEQGTVLFVSHDPASVNNLCDRAAWLHEGRLQLVGPAKDVTRAYARFCAQLVAGEAHALAALPGEAAAADAPAPAEDPGTEIAFFENILNAQGWSSGEAELLSVRVASAAEGAVLHGGERIVLGVRARVSAAIRRPIIGFVVKDRLGQSLFGHNTLGHGPVEREAVAGELEARFEFQLPLLPNGEYSVTVAVADGDLQVHTQHHWVHDAAILAVRTDRPRYGLVGIPFQSITFTETPSDP